MSELGQFIQSIPPITRTLTLSSLVMAGFNSLGIMSYSAFICDWHAVLKKLEVWRLLSCFLVAHPQPMQGLTEIYMLYRFSKGLEEGKFRHNLPDYLYYFFHIVPLILVIAFFLPMSYSLSVPLLSATTYTWSIANYDSQVSFYFMPIKASLLPAVSLGFRLVIDGKESFYLAIAGMAAAYFYNCLETQTLGPLIDLLKNGDTSNSQVSSNRVGTLHSINGGVTWIYSVGYLPAPSWLKSFISKMTGINYNSSAFHRPSSFSAGNQMRRSSTSSTSGGSSSFLKSAFQGSSSFKGKGRRLGSSE